MRSTLWNILSVTAIVLIAAGFEFGLLAARDAFFCAFAVLAIYTGHQLIAFENQPFGNAVAALFTKPEGRRARTDYLSFVGSAALGTLVVVQALTYL
ncbi:hypothetical protein M2A_2557 [Tepidicaulis marinus]|uniref:Uncharacterized protein n=1 Tax=Tepidicaulis marinus TaxID=1333998 RepID=A0A081BDE0_9HYPH|nr:hypothetical protein [Tepidicaulis marinus]GAK46058.1 hypothetical protein M2A_2557 [Tepidicaulis marinus]